jgi:hypothetical protein
MPRERGGIVGNGYGERSDGKRGPDLQERVCGNERNVPVGREQPGDGYRLAPNGLLAGSLEFGQLNLFDSRVRFRYTGAVIDSATTMKSKPPRSPAVRDPQSVLN